MESNGTKDHAVSNQTIWEAIQEMKGTMLTHFDSKIDLLQTSLDSIQNRLSTIAEHVMEKEQRVSANEDFFVGPEKARFNA